MASILARNPFHLQSPTGTLALISGFSPTDQTTSTGVKVHLWLQCRWILWNSAAIQSITLNYCRLLQCLPCSSPQPQTPSGCHWMQRGKWERFQLLVVSLSLASVSLCNLLWARDRGRRALKGHWVAPHHTHTDKHILNTQGHCWDMWPQWLIWTNSSSCLWKLKAKTLSFYFTTTLAAFQGALWGLTH